MTEEVSFQKYIFNVNKPGKYQYFAFVVTSLQEQDRNRISLGELWLLSSCPNDDIAPEIGCMCGSNGNICNEGQKCNVVVCLYPPPTPVSVIFPDYWIILCAYFNFSLFYIIIH